MAQQPKHHWHPKAKLWYANIGEKDKNGRRREVYAPSSIGERDKDAAWEWFQSARAKRKQDEAPIEPDLITVLSIVHLYLKFADSRREDGRLSIEHYRSKTHHVGHLVAAMGDRPAKDVTPGDIEELIAAWLRSYSPHYVSNICSTISAVFNWATEAKHLADNPIKGYDPPVVPRSPERYAERQEAATWLGFLWRRSRDGTPERRYDRIQTLMQRLMIHSGARPGELCCLLWTDLKWAGWTADSGHPCARATIPFNRWKAGDVTGKSRTIYVTPVLTRALRRAHDKPDRHPTHVFIHGRGRGARGGGEPWASGSRLSSTVRRLRRELIARQAKITAAIDANETVSDRDRRFASVPIKDKGDNRLTNYRWRHTAASELLMMGVDVPTVAELLGTSPEMILKHYGHLLNEHLASAASKLVGGRKRPPVKAN